MTKKSTTTVGKPLGKICADIGRNMRALINERLGHLDIDRSFYVLIIIDEGNGELSQQDLSELLDCDKVQTVRHIDYLSSIGYVNRAVNPLDRRKHTLVTTEKARKVIPDIKKAIQEVRELVLQDIPENEISMFQDTLHKIFNNIKNNKLTVK